MHIKIIRAGINDFREHKDELLEIYLEACRYELNQYVDRKEEEVYILNIFQGDGYGFFALHENQVIGFLLTTPLSHDALLSESIKQRYSIERCLYIAEMHVHGDYRRKGVGTQLMNALMEDIDRKKYDHVVIRAWRENVPAMNLYRELGFVLDETIEEEKIKPDQSGTFIMEKQYLVRKLK